MSWKQGRSQPMNIGMAEVHHKGGIGEKMLNFAYSQDLALFKQPQNDVTCV